MSFDAWIHALEAFIVLGIAATIFTVKRLQGKKEIGESVRRQF